MAGKLCSGQSQNNGHIVKDSKAYCEGRFFRGRGTGAAFPITGNPHPASTDAADAWDRGWTDVNGQAGNYVDEKDCCAAIGDVVA